MADQMPSEQNEIRDDCSQPATTYRTLIRLLVLEGWTAKNYWRKTVGAAVAVAASG